MAPTNTTLVPGMSAGSENFPGFEGAIIPFVIIMWLLSVALDYFDVYTGISEWLTRRYGGYWRDRHRNKVNSLGEVEYIPEFEDVSLTY